MVQYLLKEIPPKTSMKDVTGAQLGRVCACVRVLILNDLCALRHGL